MFRNDARLGALAALTLALALCGPAAAQMSFDNGSFGGNATTEEAPAASGGAWPSAPGGGFGGSFEGGGEAAETPAGADTGFGGSFDTQPESGTEATDPPQETAVEHAEPPEEAAEEETMPPEETAEVEPEPEDGGVDPQILAFETRDFGVPATAWLRQGEFHAATPVAVPGGALITTAELASAIDEGQAFALIDVLGGEYALPNALSAPGLASPGNYADRTQQQAVVWLAQVTGGNPGVPIVLYCSDPMCWMSYNAALRTIAAGYTNVYWYRGGLKAWQMAGLPVFPSGF